MPRFVLAIAVLALCAGCANQPAYNAPPLHQDDSLTPHDTEQRVIEGGAVMPRDTIPEVMNDSAPAAPSNK